MKCPPTGDACERAPVKPPTGHTPRRLWPCRVRAVKAATYAATFAHAASRTERIEAARRDTPPAPPLLVLALTTRATLVTLEGCAFDTRQVAGVCAPPAGFEINGLRKDGTPRKRAAAVKLSDMIKLDGCAYDEGSCLSTPPDPYFGPLDIDWLGADDLTIDVETAEAAAAWYWLTSKIPSVREPYSPATDWRRECADAEDGEIARVNAARDRSLLDIIRGKDAEGNRVGDRRWTAEESRAAQFAEAKAQSERRAPCRENSANVMARMGSGSAVVSVFVEPNEHEGQLQPPTAANPSPNVSLAHAARVAAIANAQVLHAGKFAARQKALAARKAEIAEVTGAALRAV